MVRFATNSKLWLAALGLASATACGGPATLREFLDTDAQEYTANCRRTAGEHELAVNDLTYLRPQLHAALLEGERGARRRWGVVGVTRGAAGVRARGPPARQPRPSRVVFARAVGAPGNWDHIVHQIGARRLPVPAALAP